MLRIAICDDDKILVTQIEEMLNRYLDKKMIDRYIEIFYDGASLERIYEKGDRFDIIYLDIEMSGKNGIEAAKSIRRLDRDVLLIYVSSYETYFMQLFEVEPFRFIKKPIKETEFEEVIDFAYERIIEEDAYFEYKYNKTVGKVLIRKIMYFESAGRIVNIHTEESTYRYYGKLDEVERRLVQNKIPFLRIHKSFYVNFHFVDKITFSKLILSDGTVLQISQDRQNIIRKRYLDILVVFCVYILKTGKKGKFHSHFLQIHRDLKPLIIFLQIIIESQAGTDTVPVRIYMAQDHNALLSFQHLIKNSQKFRLP